MATLSQTRRNRARYFENKRKGICVDCKKNPAMENSCRCIECSNKRRDYYERKKKASGD